MFSNPFLLPSFFQKIMSTVESTEYHESTEKTISWVGGEWWPRRNGQPGSIWLFLQFVLVFIGLFGPWFYGLSYVPYPMIVGYLLIVYVIHWIDGLSFTK